jgi:hypothetical protein
MIERADKRTIYAFRIRNNEHFYSGNDDEAVQITEGVQTDCGEAV